MHHIETFKGTLQRTWSAVKVLWLNVPFILYSFYTVTFWDTIANSLLLHELISAFCGIFPRFTFWRHQCVSVTDRDRTPKALSFAYSSRIGTEHPKLSALRTAHGRCAVDCNHFCHQLFLSLILGRSVEKQPNKQVVVNCGGIMFRSGRP